MTLRYVEREPPQPLRAFVRRIWCLESDPGDPPPAPDRVLPDGCPEIVVHYGDAFHATSAVPETVAQPRVVLVGQITTALELRPAGRVGLLGVRFEAASAGSLLRTSMRALTDGDAPLDGVSPSLARALEAAAWDGGSPAERIALAESALRPWAAAARLPRGVSEAVTAIRRGGGLARIADVAGATETCGRTLERRFLDGAGIPPKVLARIVRFQRAVRTLRDRPRARLVAIALDSGYADQAHFNREFRSFAGETPSSWTAREHPLADPFVA